MSKNIAKLKKTVSTKLSSSKKVPPPLDPKDPSGEGPGNTEKRPSQCSYYSFTWNNYDVLVNDYNIADDGSKIEDFDGSEKTLKHAETFFESIKQICQWIIMQEEICPKTGTPHLQGTLKLIKKARFTELKLYSQKVHWKATQCVPAAIEYCTKQRTRKPGGKQWIHGIEVPEEVELEEPYGWQLQVLDIIKEKPDKRTIHWFYDYNGKMGKTQLLKYLTLRHDACVIGGVAKDAFHNIATRLKKRLPCKLIVMNVPRAAIDKVDYEALEACKDGFIFSGKYESGQLCFNCPHLIIMANSKPDTGQLSPDRWALHDITDYERGKIKI